MIINRIWKGIIEEIEEERLKMYNSCVEEFYFERELEL